MKEDGEFLGAHVNMEVLGIALEVDVVTVGAFGPVTRGFVDDEGIGVELGPEGIFALGVGS